MREIARDSLAALVNRPLLLRLGALGALLAIYLAGSWVPLRVGLARAAVLALDVLGQPAAVAIQGDSVHLVVGASRVAITRACTYLDLAFILIPFTWSYGLRLRANLLRIAAVSGAIAVLNVTRLVAAVLADAGGAGWRTAHDLPDAGFYYAAIAAFVMLSARRDWRTLAARRGASHRHG